MNKINVQQKVDLIEAYETARKYYTIGAVVPFKLGSSKVPGLVLGHIFKNIRKKYSKDHFNLVCLLVVRNGKNNYVATIHSDGCYASKLDVFDFKKWKNDEYIVEVPSFLQEIGIQHS